MTKTVTNEQIENLRTDAGEHGDMQLVGVCNRALKGDSAARLECAQIIYGLTCTCCISGLKECAVHEIRRES